MASLADREAARGVSETYQYVLGDTAFYLRVEDGSVEVHDGRAEDAGVVVTTDEQTWADVVSGKTRASAARAAGALTITGDRQSVKHLRTIFSPKRMLAQPAAAGGASHAPRSKDGA
jgi:putative sterol carrier protein